MYVLGIPISIFHIDIFNNILPVSAATCCYLGHDFTTRNAHAVGENNQIYSGRMAFFAIWYDHGVLVITWPNFFYFAVFQ